MEGSGKKCGLMCHRVPQAPDAGQWHTGQDGKVSRSSDSPRDGLTALDGPQERAEAGGSRCGEARSRRWPWRPGGHCAGTEHHSWPSAPCQSLRDVSVTDGRKRSNGSKCNRNGVSHEQMPGATAPEGSSECQLSNLPTGTIDLESHGRPGQGSAVGTTAATQVRWLRGQRTAGLEAL